MSVSGVNEQGGSYGGDFYWGSSTFSLITGMTYGSLPNIDSQYFGFNLVCGKPICDNSRTPAAVSVSSVTMVVGESSAPTLSAGGIWQASGWIRGDWPLTLTGQSPSGLCSLDASLAGEPLAGDSTAPNQTVWQQCAVPPLNDAVATPGYPNGPDTLSVSGVDAAGAPASYSETIHVDNQQPTVALSGPAVASIAAGTQYVTATATAGPSGVAGVSCSVDGGQAQWYPGATTEIPVSGLGAHVVACRAANNSVDQAGQRGWSGQATQTLTIGQPTISAVGFTRIVNALRCREETKRVTIPERSRVVRRHHKRVRIRRRARTRPEKVVQCHPRTEVKWVTVRVKVRRRGRAAYVERRERQRIVLTPRTVAYGKHRLAHGKTMQVSGWLGTSSGIALGGQTVEVLTAPANGLYQFTPATTAVTAADGSWSATLPAGPSRLIASAYDGGATTLPSTSGAIQLFVRAKVRLDSVSPRRVPWGGTIHIVGQLFGGYLPTDGALVRLRIGLGNAETTYGVRTHVTGNGRFSTTYTFGAGVPSVYRTFWFQIASLPSGDYPWSPAASQRIYVRVGGHPPPARKHHHRRRRHR